MDQWGQTTQKSTLPLEACGPPSNTTHHAKQQLDWFMHLCTTTQQSPHRLQWGTPNSPKNWLFPFNDDHPYLRHPSLDQPHSPSQTAFGSKQPFFHNTFCRQTDRPTDRWSRQMFRNMSAPLAMLIDSDALITTT